MYLVSMININNSEIKEPTLGYQNCMTCQILIFGGYLKLGPSLYTWVITCISADLIHVEIKVILPRYEDFCIVHQPEWHGEQGCPQIPMPWWYKKWWNPHYRCRKGIKTRWYQYETGTTQSLRLKQSKTWASCDQFESFLHTNFLKGHWFYGE